MASWKFVTCTFNTNMQPGITIVCPTPLKTYPFGYFNNETYFNEDGAVNATFLLGLTPAPLGPYKPQADRTFTGVGVWTGPIQSAPGVWSIYYQQLTPVLTPSQAAAPEDAPQVELRCTSVSELDRPTMEKAKEYLEVLLGAFEKDLENFTKAERLISAINEELQK